MAAVRKMCILISAGCAGVERRAARLLPTLRVQAELRTVPASELLSLLSETPADAVILGREDFDLAVEIAGRSYAGVLLLAEEGEQESLSASCVASGLLLGSVDRLDQALPQLLALCARLRSMQQRTNSLRRKLDDTRLVSRAKLLLIQRFKMSEGEAHRYLEKTAMDAGERLRDVAERIIRTYEE